jgi:hypothetical protein
MPEFNLTGDAGVQPGFPIAFNVPFFAPFVFLLCASSVKSFSPEAQR